MVMHVDNLSALTPPPTLSIKVRFLSIKDQSAVQAGRSRLCRPFNLAYRNGGTQARARAQAQAQAQGKLG